MLHRLRSIRKRPLAFVLTMALLAGCSSMGMFSGAMARQQSAQIAGTVRSDANIMALLHESNLGEIMAGQQAQQRGADSAVRSFASMMITDHTNMDRQGMQMAQQWGIAPSLPDSTLPRIQQTEMNALASASGGSQFDRMYIAQQIMAHTRTLALVDASISSAQRAELRTMLQNQVRPAVASHLAMAQNIQGRVGRP